MRAWVAVVACAVIIGAVGVLLLRDGDSTDDSPPLASQLAACAHKARGPGHHHGAEEIIACYREAGKPLKTCTRPIIGDLGFGRPFVVVNHGEPRCVVRYGGSGLMPAPPIPSNVSDQIEGKRLPQARRIAHQHGWSVRVIRRDGETLAVTLDFSPTRINVVVEDSRVKRVSSVG